MTSRFTHSYTQLLIIFMLFITVLLLRKLKSILERHMRKMIHTLLIPFCMTDARALPANPWYCVVMVCFRLTGFAPPKHEVACNARLIPVSMPTFMVFCMVANTPEIFLHSTEIFLHVVSDGSGCNARRHPFYTDWQRHCRDHARGESLGDVSEI